jgi:arsenite methyltransferase
MTVAAEELKACCAAAYESDAARFLLGESFHPGGPELTSRLAAALRVGPGQLAVDVASGRGSSAIQLARETGCSVIGVDLAYGNVEAATLAASRSGVGDRVRFVQGDAESLALEDATADGAICECALCTFPGKEKAVSELARILRSGARLALSDVVADVHRLPAELRTLAGRVACLGDALPFTGIVALLERAGLAVEAAEQHDAALALLIERVGARLRVARLLGGGPLTGRVERGLELVGLAREAVDAGRLGYAVVVARKP